MPIVNDIKFAMDDIVVPYNSLELSSFSSLANGVNKLHKFQVFLNPWVPPCVFTKFPKCWECVASLWLKLNSINRASHLYIFASSSSWKTTKKESRKPKGAIYTQKKFIVWSIVARFFTMVASFHNFTLAIVACALVFCVQVTLGQLSVQRKPFFSTKIFIFNYLCSQGRS